MDITDSAVRYYCTKFKDMLNLEMSVSQVQEYGLEKDISVIEDNNANKIL